MLSMAFSFRGYCYSTYYLTYNSQGVINRMGFDEIEMAVELEIEYFDHNKELIREYSITDRIMPGGARLMTRQELIVGGSILINSADGKFQAYSLVRAAEQGRDMIWRAVVEFQGDDWKRSWIYPRSPQEQLCEELLISAKGSYSVLQAVHSQLSAGTQLNDQLLMLLKQRVDELRKTIFTVQRQFNNS